MNRFLQTLQRAADIAGKSAANWAPDSLMVLGGASIAYGAWMVYPPAGFIAAGALLIAAGVLAARGAQ